MNRITDKDLQAVVDRINRTTGSPMTSYTVISYPAPDGSGKIFKRHTANVGNYHLSYAYDRVASNVSARGAALYRMDNESGGVRDIFGGPMPKRELYERMQAWLAGYEAKGEA